MEALDDEQRAIKKRNAQALFAQGLISSEEYNMIGERYGFVEPAGTSLKSKAVTGATILGWALLALAAVAELAAARYPHLQGPLETLKKLSSLIGAAL
jgi:hypothetical protein